MKPTARWRVTALAALAAYLVVAVWVHFRARAPVETREVTVRVAHWQIELGPPEGIDAVIRRYEELNPHVRVIQMLVPTRVYRQWLRSNFAGDNAPDLVEYGAWLEGMSDVPVRYFDALTPYLEAPNPYNQGTPLEGVPWLKTFADELYEQRLNSPEPGQYYAVTMTRSALRFFCNRDLLRQITGATRTPRTLAELRGLAAQVAAYNRAHGRSIQPLAGSADNAVLMMNLYTSGVTTRLSRELDHDGLLAVYQRQTLWSYLRGEWDFQQPALRAALELLAEFSAQMKPGYQQLSRDESMREFLRGDAVFLFSGTGEATSLRRQADFPIDVLRCPQPTRDDPVVGRHILGPFADGNNMTVFGLYLNKRSPHKKEAVDFLRFLTSHEGNRLFAEKSGWAPSVREIPVAPDVAAFLTPDDGYSYIGTYLNAGGNVRALFRRNLHLLAGPQGGAEKLAAGMDAGMPGAARADLQAELRAAWLAALPQDARIAALGGLIRVVPERTEPPRMRERLEAAQNQSEARALLIAWQLRWAETKGRE